jgi:hypothetical protein
MDLKSEKGKALSKQEVFYELREFCEEQIALAQRKAMSEDNFSSASWSYHQAYLLGIQKAYSKLYNLIPSDQGDINGREFTTNSIL